MTLKRAVNEQQVIGNIKEVLQPYKKSGITAFIADKLNCSQQNINSMLRGKTTISVELASLFGYELRWVPKGKKFVPPEPRGEHSDYLEAEKQKKLARARARESIRLSC